MKQKHPFLDLRRQSVATVVAFIFFVVFIAPNPAMPYPLIALVWCILLPAMAIVLFTQLHLSLLHMSLVVGTLIKNHKPEADYASRVEISIARMLGQVPVYSSLLPHALFNRSLCMFYRRDYTQSIVLAKERIELLERSGQLALAAGPTGWGWLADLYGRTGEMNAALSIADQAMSTFKKAGKRDSLGANHYANALRCKADLLQGLYKYEESQPLYAEALAVVEQANLEERTRMLYLGFLGLAHVHLKQFENAEPLLLQAVEIARRKESKNSKVLAGLLVKLGRLYTLWGKLELAEPLMEESLSIVESIGVNQRGSVSGYQYSMGLLRLEQGRKSEAETLFKAAIAAGKENFGSQHPQLVGMLTAYQKLLEADNRDVEAKTLADEAAAIKSKYGIV